MNHRILLFILGIFAIQAGQAADLCKALELEHPLIKERARVVHFPAGRSLTLVGHVHGDRKVLRRFATWTKGANDTVTNEQWSARLEGFVEANGKVLEHARQDLGFLRASLWQAQQPIFVAVESQDADVAAHVKRSETLRSALSKAFWQRGLENTTLLRDAQLISMGGVLYSSLNDSELTDQYALIGMEGTEHGVSLQKQGKKKMDLAEARLNGFKQKQGLDQAKLNKAMAWVVDEMNKAYADIAEIITTHDQEWIRDRLKKGYRDLDPQVKGAVLAYLYGYLDYLRGMKKRDVFFARKLAAQERSGIFLFGQEHLNSLAKLLEMNCKQIKAGRPVAEEEEQPVIEEM